MTRRCVWLSVVLVVVLASVAWSAPQESATATGTATQGSRLITVTGVLTGADGHPRTGSLAMTFSLYAAQVGGDALWRESQLMTADAAGRYSVLLGATVAGGVPPGVFGDGKAQWLGVQVEGEAEQTRVLLVAVPYALRAADADTLGGKPLTSFVTSDELTKVIDERLASSTAATSAAAATGSSGAVLLGNEVGYDTWYGESAGNGGAGDFNSFFGQYSGYRNTGSRNAFFGRDTGLNNTSGEWNTYIGMGAGTANSTGSRNVYVGYMAGQNNSGSDNSFVGNFAGSGTGSASANSFFGSGAGQANTSGTGGAMFGYEAGHANTTGCCNAIFGYQAGLVSTTGAGLAIFGYRAGAANTVGQNSFFGSMAGEQNTTGAGNAFFGYQAGRANTTASDNAFFGYAAGFQTTTGESNTALGHAAGSYNTTGYSNLFLGDYAGWNNTVENYNSYIGTRTDGADGVTNATAVGYRAYVTQSNSLILGSINGVNSATADTWVGIGTTTPSAKLHVAGDVRVGDYLRGANNVVMGTGTALPGWSGNVELNNETGVGFHFRALNARFDIGPNGGSAPTYPGLLSLAMTGRVGIGTTDPQYKLHVVGDIYATGTYLGSDSRLKENIVDLGYGLREVLRLRPVSYRWKDRSTGAVALGLIAQEVAPVLPELVGRGRDEAGMLSLNYTGLVPVLVKAMQEQQAALEQKTAEVSELRAEAAERRAEATDLRARLAALEELVARLLKSDGKQSPR